MEIFKVAVANPSIAEMTAPLSFLTTPVNVIGSCKNPIESRLATNITWYLKFFVYRNMGYE